MPRCLKTIQLDKGRQISRYNAEAREKTAEETKQDTLIENIRSLLKKSAHKSELASREWRNTCIIVT